jgi:Leucine-rich repeat (LRR) protein
LDALLMDDNQLESLDEEIFKRIHRLAILMLNYNNLTTLALNIFDSQTKLRQVLLYDNQLNSINSKWFKNCERLQQLYLGYNKIQEIPEIPQNFLSTMPKLREVSFSGNPIAAIDCSILNNSNVAEISFNNIKLETVLNIDVIEELPNLESINFNADDDSCITGSFYGIKWDDMKAKVQKNCKIKEEKVCRICGGK